MKTKFFIVLFLLCCNVLFVKPDIVKGEEFGYARITNEETYLFKSPSNTIDINNVYFELEKTYFVRILEAYEEFYKVKYLNIIGYVLVNQVKLVNGTPNNPYPSNITFNINSSLNTKIRSSASMATDNNVMGIIPDSNATLSFIGKIDGEESIKTMGQGWYYCYYTYENIGCILGYVYAPLTENLTPILPNTETFSSSVEEPSTTPSSLPSDQQNILVVLLMCLPAVIIFILLVLPFNAKQNKQTSSSQRTQARKNSKKDFYEID